MWLGRAILEIEQPCGFADAGVNPEDIGRRRLGTSRSLGTASLARRTLAVHDAITALG